MHIQDESYALLRKLNGNLRDINLKGSLDLCGAACQSDADPCNDDQEKDTIMLFYHEGLKTCM